MYLLGKASIFNYFFNSSCDDLRAIRHNRISQTLRALDSDKVVHPTGKFIIFSAKQGFRYVGSSAQILNASDIFAPRKSLLPAYLFLPEPLYSLCPIVGKEKWRVVVKPKLPLVPAGVIFRILPLRRVMYRSFLPMIAPTVASLDVNVGRNTLS